MNYANAMEELYINSREMSVANIVDNTLIKMEGVITYENLPLTIPKHILTRYALTTGSYIVYEFEGSHYISDAKPTGSNLYNEPTHVTIDHNGTQLELELDVDAVLIRNDSYCKGIQDIVTEYAIMTAQAKISIWRMFIELRSNNIIRAKDESSYLSAVDYLDAQRAGDLAVIMSEELGGLDGMDVHPTSMQAGQATQLIELAQYVKSDYWGEFGININNNMKSQYVSETEISKTTGIPLINNMLKCAVEGWSKANALFGLDVKPRLSEQWNDEQERDKVINNEEPGDGEDETELEETEGTSEETESDSEEESNTEETDEEESDPEEESGEDTEVKELDPDEIEEAAELLKEDDLHDDNNDNDNSDNDDDSDRDRDRDTDTDPDNNDNRDS